jgi:hypothetical protein
MTAARLTLDNWSAQIGHLAAAAVSGAAAQPRAHHLIYTATNGSSAQCLPCSIFSPAQTQSHLAFTFKSGRSQPLINIPAASWLTNVLDGWDLMTRHCRADCWRRQPDRVPV